jgi:heme-degrading monooxygenase HmoA
MVLEQVPITVIPGREADFEVAFDEARHHVAGAAGFRSLRLSRCIEDPSSYLLLIEWDTLADHVEGFRNSPAFGQWRALVGPLWDPPPDVRHFDELVRMGDPS